MKKFLLLASALTGFAVVAQAQEGTTIKTTTVQYQVPTCTNCRTTTQVRTTYPEPEPVCNTCEPVVAQPVMMKRKEQKKLNLQCHDNHELGIRNPLFVLRQGQFSLQEAAGVFKEPKRKLKSYDEYGERNVKGEYRGWQAHMTLAYGITDKWSIRAFGGKKYTIPKTKQYRAFQEEEAIRRGLPPEAGHGPIPHESGYDATLGTYYHILDLCHLDAIVGVEGTWHREKTKTGNQTRRVNGWAWAPTVTVGSNWGWFTPYVSAAYQWDHTHAVKNEETGKKEWVDNHGYYVNPGIYIQPSKWYAFDLNIQKQEHEEGQWNAGVDFYPYKNVALGAQFNARRPFKHPMHMYGVSGVAKIVF